MKNIVILIVASLMALGFGQIPIDTGYAVNYEMYDEADSVFIKTVDDILQDEETEDVRIVAEKEVIHDIDLNPLGLVYDFCVDDSAGYAIVLQQAEEFIVPEIFLDAVNPYKEVPDENCKKVYLNTMSYLYYNEEGYFEPKTQLSVDTDILEQVYGSSYRGGGVPSYTSETISYTYRNENNTEIVKRHPAYYEDGVLQNACAAIAGTNIISYYDRYYENLIPNYTPGSKMGTMYLYKEQNGNVVSVMRQLNTDMQNKGSGTTLSQFKSGMTKYVNTKGLAITYESCKTNGSLNLLKVKENIDEEKPIALFLSGFNLSTISVGSNTDSINYKLVDTNHVMVCFGIKEVSYQFANGSTQKNTYFQVASGLQSQARGYYQLNYNGQINEALAISIQ